jgi:hypothetical protein
MRYLTWELTWPGYHRYGFGPEPVVAENGGRLEASQWVNPTVEAGTILGYLDGDMDLGLIGAWNATELAQADALAFAAAIDPNAYVGDDGRIATTTEPEQ